MIIIHNELCIKIFHQHLDLRKQFFPELKIYSDPTKSNSCENNLLVLSVPQNFRVENLKMARIQGISKTNANICLK